MERVTVSVIIPTHNRARLLPRAIRSVLAQTFRDFELIVVDDGSTDDTSAVVTAIPDARILYVRLEQRGGAGRARNAGLAVARGEFVALLDDDDEWLPEKLEKQIAVIRDAPACVCAVYSGFMTIADSNGRIVREWRAVDQNTAFDDFLDSSKFMTSVVLIRRTCLDAVGAFDEELVGCQDKDLWLRLSRRFAFNGVPEILVKYHVHGAQITTNLPAKILAKEQILFKYLDDLMARPQLLAKHLYRIGLLYCAAGFALDGRRYLMEALTAGARSGEIRWHVVFSLLAPRAHRNFLIAHVLPSVEGVTLFY